MGGVNMAVAQRIEINSSPFMGKKLRVCAYCRVSSNSADQLNSYATQVRHYTKAIQAHADWEYVDIFADEGITGTSADKRTEFQRMIQMCQHKRIDLIINLETWIQGKMYDRLGLDEETTNILGLEIPSITIPVKPGRNLAIILEIAAMNNRQKKMGYNTAEEFNKKLMGQMGLN